MEIWVRYVPIPVRGAVFASTGTVWKILACIVPVTNPIQDIHISHVMVMMTLDYIIVITVELTSKNGYRTYPYHVLW